MSKTLLSIQSHVSHGYVGGKAAIFPLQTQGWEVDNINTVNFSNHTGYGSFKGTSIKEGELSNILEGLNDIQLTYDAIITGYIPNARLISTMSQHIKELKLKNPHLLYLLDPVMGDQGYLYVDKSCIDEYKNILNEKLVDIITPNQFELELLCNFKIHNGDDLKKAIRFIHDEFDIKYVVITSLNSELKISRSVKQDDLIYCAISSSSNANDIQVFNIPVIKSYFTGVGDLFSALLLDKLYNNLQSGESSLKILSRSVNQVLTIMMKTLKLTHKLGLESYCKSKGLTATDDLQLVGKINDGDTMKYFELRIVQSRQFYDYIDDGDFHPKFLET